MDACRTQQQGNSCTCHQHSSSQTTSGSWAPAQPFKLERLCWPSAPSALPILPSPTRASGHRQSQRHKKRPPQEQKPRQEQGQEKAVTLHVLVFLLLFKLSPRIYNVANSVVQLHILEAKSGLSIHLVVTEHCHAPPPDCPPAFYNNPIHTHAATAMLKLTKQPRAAGLQHSLSK